MTPNDPKLNKKTIDAKIIGINVEGEVALEHAQVMVSFEEINNPEHRDTLTLGSTEAEKLRKDLGSDNYHAMENSLIKADYVDNELTRIYQASE